MYNNISNIESNRYIRNMSVLFEYGDISNVLDYLALNQLSNCGKRRIFFKENLLYLLHEYNIDKREFFNNFYIELAQGLRLDNLSAWYYEVPTGNIVTKKYVYDNINLLMVHLNFYRAHNIIFIDGDPVFIPSTDIPDNMKIIDYAKFLVDLNYLFEYYTPAELSDAKEKLKPVLETECSFTKQELKEKIVSLDIKNQRLLAEIRRLLR